MAFIKLLGKAFTVCKRSTKAIKVFSYITLVVYDVEKLIRFEILRDEIFTNNYLGNTDYYDRTNFMHRQ